MGRATLRSATSFDASVGSLLCKGSTADPPGAVIEENEDGEDVCSALRAPSGKNQCREVMFVYVHLSVVFVFVVVAAAAAVVVVLVVVVVAVVVMVVV